MEDATSDLFGQGQIGEIGYDFGGQPLEQPIESGYDSFVRRPSVNETTPLLYRRTEASRSSKSGVAPSP
jgi:hypothetical protein